MDEEIKKLLTQNLAKNEEMYDILKRVKRYLVFSQIFSVLRLLLIIVPLILAFWPLYS